MMAGPLTCWAEFMATDAATDRETPIGVLHGETADVILNRALLLSLTWGW